MPFNYINLDRVKAAMPASYDGSDDLSLQLCLNAASQFLDMHCNRTCNSTTDVVGTYNGGFALNTYDVLLNGSGDHLLFLPYRPIVSISRLATITLPAVSVHNTDSDMGTRATVALTTTGVTLTYTKAAVTTTNTFTFTSYPTVTALVNAMNGAGNFWTATVMGGFGNWSSSDLRATQGAFGARITTAYLWIHWMDLPWYRVNELTGEVYSPMGFTRGVLNFRCTFQAGYSVFPDDLAQALAELTVATYANKETNANLQSEATGDYNYNRLVGMTFQGLSDVSRRTINNYRIRPVPHFSTW